MKVSYGVRYVESIKTQKCRGKVARRNVEVQIIDKGFRVETADLHGNNYQVVYGENPKTVTVRAMPTY